MASPFDQCCSSLFARPRAAGLVSLKFHQIREGRIPRIVPRSSVIVLLIALSSFLIWRALILPNFPMGPPRRPPSRHVTPTAIAKLTSYAETRAHALKAIEARVRATLLADQLERVAHWATGGVAVATYALLQRLAECCQAGNEATKDEL